MAGGAYTVHYASGSFFEKEAKRMLVDRQTNALAPRVHPVPVKEAWEILEDAKDAELDAFIAGLNLGGATE